MSKQGEQITFRVTPEEKKAINKKVADIVAALGGNAGNHFDITRSTVIKYCMFDSLLLLPEGSINPRLVSLKKGLI